MLTMTYSKISRQNDFAPESSRRAAPVFISKNILPGRALTNFGMYNRSSVQENEVYGRYLVAKDDVLKGEVIIEETPFAVGPKLSSPALCLECFCKVSPSDDGSRCPKCEWPLCEDCIIRGAKLHQSECSIFSKCKQIFYPLENDAAGCPQLDCITALRCIRIIMIYL